MNVSFLEFCTKSTQAMPSLLFLNEFPKAVLDKFKDAGCTAQTSIFSLRSLFYDSLERLLRNPLGFPTLILPFYARQEMIHTCIVAICESDVLHREGAHVWNAGPEGDSLPYPTRAFGIFPVFLHKLVKHVSVVLFILNAISDIMPVTSLCQIT